MGADGVPLYNLKIEVEMRRMGCLDTDAAVLGVHYSAVLTGGLVSCCLLAILLCLVCWYAISRVQLAMLETLC